MFSYIKSFYFHYFRSIKPLLLFFTILIIIFFITLFSDIFVPVLSSIIIAYLLESIIKFISKLLNVNRIFILYCVFILFIATLVFVFIFLLPRLFYQLVEFMRNVPYHVRNLENHLYFVSEKYPKFFNNEHVNYIINVIGSINFDKLASISQYLIKFSFNSVSRVFTCLVYVFIVPILSFFFIKDKNLIGHWFLTIFPIVINILEEFWLNIHIQLGNYIKGKTIELLIVTIVTYLGFIYFCINYSLLLAILVGLSTLLPYIGMLIAVVPIVIISIGQYGIDYNILYIILFYFFVQFLDGNLLVPILYSETLSLHPIAIIISILFFGRIWGFWGLFFSIPLAILINSCIKVFMRHRIMINN